MPGASEASRQGASGSGTEAANTRRAKVGTETEPWPDCGRRRCRRCVIAFAGFASLDMVAPAAHGGEACAFGGGRVIHGDSSGSGTPQGVPLLRDPRGSLLKLRVGAGFGLRSGSGAALPGLRPRGCKTGDRARSSRIHVLSEGRPGVLDEPPGAPDPRRVVTDRRH